MLWVIEALVRIGCVCYLCPSKQIETIFNKVSTWLFKVVELDLCFFWMCHWARICLTRGWDNPGLFLKQNSHNPVSFKRIFFPIGCLILFMRICTDILEGGNRNSENLSWLSEEPARWWKWSRRGEHSASSPTAWQAWASCWTGPMSSWGSCTAPGGGGGWTEACGGKQHSQVRRRSKAKKEALPTEKPETVKTHLRAWHDSCRSWWAAWWASTTARPSTWWKSSLRWSATIWASSPSPTAGEARSASIGATHSSFFIPLK